MKTFFSSCRYHVVLVAVSLCLVFSCKKAKDDHITPAGQYYVRFKVNGAQKEFTGRTESTVNKKTGATQNLYLFELAGFQELFVGNRNTLTVVVSAYSPVKLNTTYTNYDASLPAHERAKTLVLGYFDENGIAFVAFDGVFANLGIIADSKATVTALSETTVKGTFSGTLYNTDRTASVVISEGEFSAQRLE